jgi:presenilin-like A22 family membrane protease
MSNDNTASPGGKKASGKESKAFKAVEAELRAEDSLLLMMREQMTSMLGMMGMFILTIVIGLYIRPWYDVAGLHAFGESGATQVRYILLELVMIFIFTAFILALAKYKKDWIIKYGIMGVLCLALMYSTVPLAHMVMIDLDSEPYEIEATTEFESAYIGHSGYDGHFMSEVTGGEGTWGENVSFYRGHSMAGEEPTWTNQHVRYPHSDEFTLHVSVDEDVFTFANGAWVWYVNAETGETIDSYTCVQTTTIDGEEEFTGYLAALGTGCMVGFHTNDAMYIVDEGNFLHRFNTFEETPGLMVTQAKWRLPFGLDAHLGTLHTEVIAEDKVLIATPTMVAVILLEETAPAFDSNLPDINNMATVLFQHNASSKFTSADFGPSPWSTTPYDLASNQEGLILLGEENGDVIGFEWNATQDTEFTPQTNMNLEGFGETIQSVRLTDRDFSGYSDMLITTESQAHWLWTTSLLNKISLDIDEGFETGWFANTTDNQTHFHALYSTESTTIDSGLITEDMDVVSGLQLYDVPLILGVIVALVLMVLLYVHSEWYVVNTVGVLVGSGVVVMLGVAFVPTLIIVFMIAAAIYDAWAVYKSKHMLDLADTMINLRLPILLVAPQEKGYSFVEETSSMKDRDAAAPAPSKGAPKKQKGKDAMFMGLGDVIFPGMLVLSAAQWLDSSGAFAVAISTLVGGLVGYFALMTYVARGRAQAGLPLLNGGSILGYVIGGYIFIGSAIFDFGISI